MGCVEQSCLCAAVMHVVWHGRHVCWSHFNTLSLLSTGLTLSLLSVGVTAATAQVQSQASQETPPMAGCSTKVYQYKSLTQLAGRKHLPFCQRNHPSPTPLQQQASPQQQQEIWVMVLVTMVVTVLMHAKSGIWTRQSRRSWLMHLS